MRALVRHLREKAGMSRENAKKMRPYLIRFVEDLEAAKTEESAPKGE